MKKKRPWYHTAATLFCIMTVLGTAVLQAVVIYDHSKESNGYIEAVAVWDPYALNGAEERLLERFICAEGKDEPFVCKVAIAAVVFNRIKSESHPSTAVNVIFEANVFPATQNGELSSDYSNGEMRMALRAIRLAQSGEDPSGGAMCFCKIADDQTTVGHMPDAVTFRAGNMIFGNP